MLYFLDCYNNEITCKKAFKLLANNGCCKAIIGNNVAYIEKTDNRITYSVAHNDEMNTYFADSIKEALRCAINYITTDYYNEHCA
jgi:hypothetical protein